MRTMRLFVDFNNIDDNSDFDSNSEISDEDSSISKLIDIRKKAATFE